MEQPRRPIDWSAVHARLEATERALATATSPPHDVVKQILRNRAQAWARSQADIEPAGAVLDLLIFTLAGERYGIETAQVLEVLVLRGLTAVPCTPPFILGVVNLRGRIVAVLDLRRLLNLSSPEIPERGLVIVVEAGGMAFGIFADTVVGTSRTGAQDVGPPPLPHNGDRSAFIRGVTGEMVAALDLDALARDPRLSINVEVD